MLKIAICDDEKIFLQKIGKLVLDYVNKNNINIEVQYFLSGEELLGVKDSYDIIFLDVEMPKVSGIEVGYQLKKRNNQAKIILVTSHNEVYKTGYKIDAFRFVTKPIDKEELFEAIESAISAMIGQNRVLLSTNGAKQSVKQKDIIYVLADGSQTILFTKNMSYRSEKTLEYWGEELDKRLFVRTHRSYLINMSVIVSFTKNEISIETGEKIPISRRKYNDFRKKYIEFDVNYR